VPDERIIVTGNPVIDALHWVADLPATPKVHDLLQRLGIADDAEEQGGRGAKERPICAAQPGVI